MQSVLIMLCFICKVSLLCSALYAKCLYYVVLYMQRRGHAGGMFHGPWRSVHDRDRLLESKSGVRRKVLTDELRPGVGFIKHKPLFTMPQTAKTLNTLSPKLSHIQITIIAPNILMHDKVPFLDFSCNSPQRWSWKVASGGVVGVRRKTLLKVQVVWNLLFRPATQFTYMPEIYKLGCTCERMYPGDVMRLTQC